MSKAVTQHDLARIAGVSHMTVSRALRGHDDVLPETRARIEILAEQHGYRLNRGARAMRRGRYGAVGLLLSETNAASSLMPGFMAGLRKAAATAGLHLVLGELPDDRLRSAETLPKLLQEWSVDGLIVHYTHDAPQELAQIFARYRMKAVWTNTDRLKNAVTPDDLGAGATAAERIFAWGHRNSFYVDSPLGNHPSLAARREGFVQRFRKLGGTCEVVLSGGADPAWAKALHRDRPDVTACVAYRLDDAARLIYTADAAGRRVPEDLSVVTFAPRPERYAGIIPFTQLRVPIERVGREAVALLDTMLAQDLTNHQTRYIPLDWVDGATAGPVSVERPRPITLLDQGGQ
jgi:DNA-binding LacI/PurR family transcriptional regulator